MSWPCMDLDRLASREQNIHDEVHKGRQMVGDLLLWR